MGRAAGRFPGARARRAADLRRRAARRLVAAVRTAGRAAGLEPAARCQPLPRAREPRAGDARGPRLGSAAYPFRCAPARARGADAARVPLAAVSDAAGRAIALLPAARRVGAQRRSPRHPVHGERPDRDEHGRADGSWAKHRGRLSLDAAAASRGVAEARPDAVAAHRPHSGFFRCRRPPAPARARLRERDPAQGSAPFGMGEAARGGRSHGSPAAEDPAAPQAALEPAVRCAARGVRGGVRAGSLRGCADHRLRSGRGWTPLPAAAAVAL